MEIFEKTHISGWNFPSSKNKKTYSKKISYISRNGTLWLLYFFKKKLYFRREL